MVFTSNVQTKSVEGRTALSRTPGWLAPPRSRARDVGGSGRLTATG